MKSIKLKQHNIGNGMRPFVIAELSGNHNQSIERAMQIVEAAAKAGADAVKLQTYTANTMTINCNQPDFVVSGTSEQWQNRTLYDLYDEAHTPWDWHKAIFERCYELGMTPFSTPFDETAVDFLESLNMEIYKIASFEMTDIPLLRKVANTGKPIIMSTGMASEQEIELAVSTLKSENCEQLVLLKCTSAYPARFEDSNAKTIPYLANKYACLSGLSDHTLGAAVPVTATALGATVIEKHLTLNRDDGGVDSHFSMQPNEFKQMVELVHQSFAALGGVQTQPSHAELACRNYRRSIYVVKDIAADECLTADNIRIIRPGFGLAPSAFEKVLGKPVNQPLLRGTALQSSMLKTD
jgi:N-acetylneuraminate synthase